MWTDTIKAAWSKIELYGAVACRAPEVPVEKFEAVQEKALELMALNEQSAERTTLTEEVTLPLVGIVEEVGPRTNRTRQVTLLSGWAALTAAHQVKASVPVYPLPDAAREALTEAGLLHPKGVLLDRGAAVALLVSQNFGIAAELLADNSDPIDAEAPAPELTPEEQAA